jgi:integrase/recombinase XerD
MRSVMYAFNEYLIGQGLSARTINIYIRLVAAAFDYGLDLATVTASALSAYASTLPFSHSLRGQFAAAVRHYWEMVGRYDGPIRAIRVPPQPEMVCQAVDDNQARDLVKTALGWQPEGLAVLFGMYLALRREEIAQAEWHRFSDGYAWYRVTGKGDKTATLPVNPVLASELKGGTGYVFPGRFGGHVSPATIWDWAKKVGRAAGIDGMRTHQLRHTALTVANDTTGDLRAVQTFARHSKPSTTAGYTRTKAQRLREVSDALTYL